MSGSQHRITLPRRPAAATARQDDDEQFARYIQEQERQHVANQHMADFAAEAAEVGFTPAELRLARDYELALQLDAEERTYDGGAMGSDEPFDDAPTQANAGGQTHGESATCTACAEEHPMSELAATACDHLYCSPCLSTIFRQAMTDEAYFPPRCCQQEISVDTSKHFLGPQLVEAFETKALEFRTADRTYCHNPTCSTFIPPSTFRRRLAHCPTCNSITCPLCKAASHAGECPQDPDLQQTLDEAARQGWKRCECGQIVELDHGCNHMTCRCRREFCYICGARWKTCRCAQWDEGRLYRQAEQVVDRNPVRIFHHVRQAFGHLVGQGQRNVQPQPAQQQQARYEEQVQQLEEQIRQQEELVQFQETLREHNAQQRLQRQNAHLLAQQQPAGQQHAQQQHAQQQHAQQQHAQQQHAQPHHPQEGQGEQHHQAREARIHQVAQQLRENHECRHRQRWRRFKGYHRCPVCGKQKKDTVGECKICFLVACYHCRRHRL